jgi:two-component system nitrogen regulation response regulator NtrX
MVNGEAARPLVLVVDDDPEVRKLLSYLLKYDGLDVVPAATGKEALDLLDTREFSLAFLDYQLPDTDGLRVLAAALKHKPSLPVIMMSGFGTIKLAVQATKQGAYDFIEKPLDTDRVVMTMRHALERQHLQREVASLRAECRSQYEMVGSSAAMRRLQEMIDRIAPSRASVLILGESGAGKELAARAIHERSPVKSGPFVRINCAAIPQELIESELFGHEKGAFTGAVAQKPGKLELAHSGTVFLDEIGDMNLYVQAKLLRFLQEGEFEHVGGTKTLKVEVRTLAATNKNLIEEIGDQRFREDLYYRLNVVTLEVPPLRERREDIPVLAQYFLSRYCEEHAVPLKSLTDDAVSLLAAQHWPGNVREFANVIQRSVVLVPGPTLSASDIEPLLITRAGDVPVSRALKDAREEFERRHIMAVLAECRGNVTEAARILDVERTSLYRITERLGLKLDSR